MEYAKIIVKNNYEHRGDLVLRSYIRALRKVQEGRLLDGDNAAIYGIIGKDGKFYELFTNKVINHDEYIMVTIDEIFDVATMDESRKGMLNRIVRKVLFGEDIELGFEVSTMEELAKDRAIELDAYESRLSRINPYQRLNQGDPTNDYNSFSHKLAEIHAIRRIDRKSNQIEFDEYEVLENPRRLTKSIKEEC